MRKKWLLAILGIVTTAIVGLTLTPRLIAAPVFQAEPESEEAQDTLPPPSNNYCLLCHNQPDLTWHLPSGETLNVTVDAAILAASVHGSSNPEGALNCADCHVDHRFPHPPPESQTIREFTLERYATCRNCHEDQYTHAQDSVHGLAIREGRVDAATCVDCHGSHDIQPPDDPPQRVSFTCGKCHGAIFDQYQDSVHGSALIAEGNTDVPTCVDCHGVHNITDPTTASFRVRSPEICATCHADVELMAKYDISTNVFDSYLTDFHGTTVALFEQQSPDVATNKAVCYDCHGVHDIAAASNEKSRVVRENLLATCQDCHPNATTDFPDAWVGHFPPTLQSHPLLFTVDLFYQILIPATLGGFILLVATDIFRRIRERLFGHRKHAGGDND
jgi:hypothetical protein